MIREGLELMVVGMSGVFVFLFLLVGLMQASGRLWVVLDRWFPEAAPASGGPAAGGGGASSAASSSSDGADDEGRLAVAIALARAAQEQARAGRSAALSTGGRA